MKIYCTSPRVEELTRERDAWDAESDRRDAIHKQERAVYQKAQDELLAPLDYKLSTELKKFNLLEFEVDVRFNSYSRRDGIEVKIRCNDRQKFDENVALAWDWSVQLDDNGEILKNSGSWSGLKAYTKPQMENLFQCVQALDYLNSIDWEPLLRVDEPKFEDYFTEFESRGSRPNFEDQMKQAELEEFIGSPVLIKGSGIQSLHEYYSHRTYWYAIHRETPKKYIVSFSNDYEIEAFRNQGMSDSEIAEGVSSSRWSYQVKKEYLLEALQYPFVTLQ